MRTDRHRDQPPSDLAPFVISGLSDDSHHHRRFDSSYKFDKDGRISKRQDWVRSPRIRKKREFSPKILVGSPYDTKDQAKFPTSGSVKSHRMKDTVLHINHES